MMREILVEYVHILSDPAHVLVEFTFVLIDYLVIQGVLKRWAKRRDRKHGHGVDNAESVL